MKTLKVLMALLSIWSVSLAQNSPKRERMVNQDTYITENDLTSVLSTKNKAFRDVTWKRFKKIALFYGSEKRKVGDKYYTLYRIGFRKEQMYMIESFVKTL